MSKKNKKQADKRRAKKREKQRRKRPARIAKRNAASKARGEALARRLKKVGDAKELLESGVAVPDITEEEYVWWLCHGANFLASDMETGVWNPIFEGIYSGNVPEPEDIAQTVMRRYADEFESDDHMTGQGAAVLTWTVSNKANVRIYKYEAERRLTEKDPEADASALARMPHNGTVWSVLDKFRSTVINAQKAAAAENEQAQEES